MSLLEDAEVREYACFREREVQARWEEFSQQGFHCLLLKPISK